MSINNLYFLNAIDLVLSNCKLKNGLEKNLDLGYSKSKYKKNTVM